jgi:uncharacterized protein involved in exopolysaccharide biosynthesis
VLQETRREISAVGDEYEDGPAIDVHALFARVLAKGWWVIACVVLFAVVFCVAAFRMNPIYRATTVLVPAAGDRGTDVAGAAPGALSGLTSGLVIGAPRDIETQEALAVLRSREFTERFIVNRDLMPKLFPRAWDVARGTWNGDAESRPTLAKAYKRFDSKVRLIVQDRKTGLITLQIDWKDRDEAARWANDLVTQVNDEMRRRAIEKADTSMQFLEKELQTTSTLEARQAIGRLMESQVKQRMLANVTHDYSFRVVDRAISSDGDEPVWPQKTLLTGVGVLVGLMVGIVCALALTSAGARREARSNRESAL